jgi:hypothetical protein
MKGSQLKRRIQHADQLLSDIQTAYDGGKARRAKYLTDKYLNSFDARRVAVGAAAAAMRPESRPPRKEFDDIARTLDAWSGTDEPVRVHLLPKGSDPNDRRVVCEFGIRNKALQYLSRAALRPSAPLNPRQFGMFGVPAAIAHVASAISQGATWAVEVDIKNCYPSFNGSKLNDLLPLSTGVIERVIISRYLNLVPGNLIDLFGPPEGEDWGTIPAIDDALADARLGIPQGSAASPLVAEYLLSGMFAPLSELGEFANYADNTLLLASSESSVVSMSKALGSALEAHPVGRLRPKIRSFPPGEPILFLGHEIRIKSGQIRIFPSTENAQIFAAKMQRSLKRLREMSGKRKEKHAHNLKRYVVSWTGAFRECHDIGVTRQLWLSKIKDA